MKIDDKFIYMILCFVMGILFCFAFFMKSEPLEVKTLAWRDKWTHDSTEFHHHHYITVEGDTADIDTNTRLMDMSIVHYEKEFNPPLSINNQIINPPIFVEAEVRGILYSLAVETKDNWSINLGEQKCKTDWKLPLIFFAGGIILGVVVD